MRQSRHGFCALQRPAKLLALALIPALAVFFSLATASAQEPTQDATPVTTDTGEATPVATGTVEPTPDLSIKTVVRLEVDPQTEPIGRGKEFEVRVMVDDVEHLAGFSFTISYDPKRLQPVGESSSDLTPVATAIPGLSGEPVKNRALGDLLASSPRGEGIICTGPVTQNDTVTASCVTRAPPVCLGGAAGASGSGLLGAVYLKSKGGGPTVLTLTESELALDDYDDCSAQVVGAQDILPDNCLPFRQDPSTSAPQLSCELDGTMGLIVEGPIDAEGQSWVRLETQGWALAEYLQPNGSVANIPNRHQNVTIDLAKGGGGSSTLLIVIIAVVVVVVVVGGGTGGYLWYQRRQSRPTV